MEVASDGDFEFPVICKSKRNCLLLVGGEDRDMGTLSLHKHTAHTSSISL